MTTTNNLKSKLVQLLAFISSKRETVARCFDAEYKQRVMTRIEDELLALASELTQEQLATVGKHLDTLRWALDSENFAEQLKRMHTALTTIKQELRKEQECKDTVEHWTNVASQLANGTLLDDEQEQPVKQESTKTNNLKALATGLKHLESERNYTKAYSTARNLLAQLCLDVGEQAYANTIMSARSQHQVTEQVNKVVEHINSIIQQLEQESQQKDEGVQAALDLADRIAEKAPAKYPQEPQKVLPTTQEEVKQWFASLPIDSADVKHEVNNNRVVKIRIPNANKEMFDMLVSSLRKGKAYNATYSEVRDVRAAKCYEYLIILNARGTLSIIFDELEKQEPEHFQFIDQ